MPDLSVVKQVFLDMDGTIYHGQTLYPTTKPFLNFLRTRGINYAFISNNSSRSRATYVQRLQKFGIASTIKDFYTSMEFCLDYLQLHHPEFRRVFWLGMDDLKSTIEARRLEVVETEPDAVLIGYDTKLTYERLCRCAWLLSQDVPGFATHPDLYCPGDQPTWLVDCGAITLALEASTGKKVTMLGKPHPDMLKFAAKYYGVQPSECLMIGDRLSTDIASGINSGCLTCQITGVGADHTAVPGIAADWRCDNLGELQQLWN